MTLIRHSPFKRIGLNDLLFLMDASAGFFFIGTTNLYNLKTPWEKTSVKKTLNKIYDYLKESFESKNM